MKSTGFSQSAFFLLVCRGWGNKAEPSESAKRTQSFNESRRTTAQYASYPGRVPSLLEVGRDGIADDGRGESNQRRAIGRMTNSDGLLLGYVSLNSSKAETSAPERE